MIMIIHLSNLNLICIIKEKTMKYRKDFVTNSSSSSYTCEICGETESGWDLCLSEAEMCKCVNGHVFCTEHELPRPNKKEMIKMILESKYNECEEEELEAISKETLYTEYLTDGGSYGVPEAVCPICQFIDYSENDLAAYLLKRYGVPRDEVFKEVKSFNKRRKKLYDSEYVTYVCQKFNLNPSEIVSTWKEDFGTYENFYKYIR